jgi:hypothetical protein
MKKYVLLISLTLSLMLPGPAFSREVFTDINSDNPDFEAVNQVVNDYKIMTGFPNKTFRGTGDVDRYTYSVILFNTIELLNKKMQEIEQEKILDTVPDSDSPKFSNITDLEKDHWAYNKAIALLRLGLIRTFSDNTFRGSKNVDYIGFAIGMGRLMKVIYDDAPPVLKRKWQREIVRSVQSIKGIPQDSPVFEPLKLAIENNLIDTKPGAGLTKDITRYDVAISLTRLINKLDELRKYMVFTRIG